MYSALLIGNYFIERGLSDHSPLTPMQVLKMVYIAHGFHLALRDEPLITEQVEAWQYGPVIPELYFALNKFGRRPVTEKIEDVADQILPENTLSILSAVYLQYKALSGSQLSTRTHKEGTPWSKVWTAERTGWSNVIENDLVKEYYRHTMVTNG